MIISARFFQLVVYDAILASILNQLVVRSANDANAQLVAILPMSRDTQLSVDMQISSNSISDFDAPLVVAEIASAFSRMHPIQAARIAARAKGSAITAVASNSTPKPRSST